MSNTEHPSSEDHSAHHPKSVRRRVLSLAGPVIAENLLQTLLGIVDTALVARLGANALAGVGSAQQVMFFLIAALSALAIGSSVLVAQAVGGRNLAHASILARQSLLWSFLLSIPLAIVGLVFAGPIMGVFRLEPEVTRIGTEYLSVTMGTVVVLVGLFIGGGVLRGAGDARTPMLITAAANVVNGVLAYGMIYGEFGLPALGAVGSAWSTFIARAIALLLLLWALWRGRNGVSISSSEGWRLDFGVARTVLKIGIPAAVEQVLSSAAFFMLTVIVATLGTATLAAQQIAFSALSFSFLPGLGFGIAATALVGQSIGARNIRAGAAATRVAVHWALGWMGGIGVLLFIFATPMMRVFTTDELVIVAGADALRIIAIAQPLWVFIFVLPGALRGTGNTRFPMIVGSGGTWLSVGIVSLFLHMLGDSLLHVWLLFLAPSPLVVLLFWWRWRRSVQELSDAEHAQRAAAVVGDQPAST